MPTQSPAMHVALNVHDLERSAAFYTALFGQPAAKLRPDYAKFEPGALPLVLSLNRAPSTSGARAADRLSHLGVRVDSDAHLDEARARIAAAGLEIGLEEPGVTCCYAVQNKFWVTDPDGNSWEWYRVLADAEERAPGGDDAAGAGCCAESVACSEEMC